ncbi:MAG: hypothetical protein GWM87_10990 [Xanthomonadales bacterium]|nr:hypothetical protein [Xanthomonadales bacterium]NIX13403.1 hypothetical protein [Xanthomonadales bacterium]
MKTLTRIYPGLLLFAMGFSANGAETQRLVNIRDSYPSASPDGTQLVFQSNRTGTAQLFIQGMDGGDIRQLTTLERGAETPVFSPDGARILFGAYVGEGDNNVFVMEPDGGGITQLTSGPGYDGHPHWSADGQRIVFNSDRNTPDPDAGWSDRWHDIYSMRADGSDVQRHTWCEAVCTYGSFSPDGQKVLYRKVIRGAGLNWALQPIEKNSEVFVADPDGSNEVNLSDHPAFDGWPVWSPDGQWIAFASNRAGPELTGQVWLIRPDGSGLRQLTEGEWSHVQPAWSADSRSIFAYQGRETEQYEFGSVVRITVAMD